MRFDRVVMVGFKHSGKTVVGKSLASMLGWEFLDIDDLIAKAHVETGAGSDTVREIYSKLGKGGFQELEGKAIAGAASRSRAVIALGGASPMNPSFDRKKFGNALLVYLRAEPSILFERIEKGGFPPFFDKADPRGSFDRLLAERSPVYEELADISVDNTGRSPEETAKDILDGMEKVNAG